MIKSLIQIALFQLIPCLFLCGSAVPDSSSKFSKGPVPAWVKECSFSVESPPTQQNQVHVQQLLEDTQRHLEEQTLYWHYAVKALTNIGVEQIAQFNIDFNPSYQKFIVHTINVYRDGQCIDRLEKTRLELLQREARLESSLYSGEFTLAHFLDDIRPGDVVEYACSFVGYNPLFSSHYSNWVLFQHSSSIDKLSSRVLFDPKRPLSFKLYRCPLQPTITDISPHRREWLWETYSTLPCPYEPGQPSWHFPHACVQISQYKSWQEVAAQIAPLFKLSKDFLKDIPADMASLSRHGKKPLLTHLNKPSLHFATFKMK